MEQYVQQLLSDINHASENIAWPFVLSNDIWDWKSDEEENLTAPVRRLDEWTGLNKKQLPPDSLLTDVQVDSLLGALHKLLDARNCSFVLQTTVPARFQYAAIRDQWDQTVKLKQWHMGFFEPCRPGTEHKSCALGEYCQCLFYHELLSGFSNEELSPEEERAMELRCEIRHIQRRYGDDWMKYYPYHLDPAYDDENGNPYDYDFGSGEDDDEEPDEWWRR